MSEHEKHEYEELFIHQLTKFVAGKNVSQRAMSLDIGQSEGYINKLMSGHNLPKMLPFFWICDYLNIHPKEFFDDGFEMPSEVDLIVKDLVKLDAEQIAIVKALVVNLAKK